MKSSGTKLPLWVHKLKFANFRKHNFEKQILRIADRKSDIEQEVKMKKPEVYRKMYTGAEMYRNERQERLSQQMDKLNSDFIKMLYAGGIEIQCTYEIKIVTK